MRLLTLRSLLVATDLEGGSVAALRTAARLGSLSGAQLHLLHVAETAPSVGVERLREEYTRAVADGPELVTVDVLTGSAPEVIVDQAVRLGADAIVLGPHRRGGEQSGEMGSTAAAVVRRAACPCLVATVELKLPLQRVLTALDLSAGARGTLNVALSWTSALRPRGQRALLTALHVDSGSGGEGERRIEEKVAQLRGEVGDAAHVEVSTRIAGGTDAASVIVDEALAEAVDLLVIGTRRASNTPGELGSVSTLVAKGTPCPLLLVPPGMAREGGER